ncbi:MAG: hydroxymethylpyrimidine/phosphomethylpyrimidine kinase [Leptospiraceae bacterium]|nr:MAG: hydroxymethylpyrimidine/phosphomethylpyrimidine kinase [Leptospiraceae bacterium]
MKPVCLTIAGIDNCAAAGIYADLKTFHNLGCYGVAAVTTITVQTIQNVVAIEPVKDFLLEEQLASLFFSFDIKALKTGMIYKKSHFKIIKRYFEQNNLPIVIDPIIRASSGKEFIQKNAIKYLIEIFPFATILTPNIPEALFLLKKKQYPVNLNDLKQLSFEFYKEYKIPLLLKGGHFYNSDFIYDVFFDGKEFFILKTKKISKKNIRGTGCTLSAALTSYLAKQYSLKKAIHKAKKYIVKQIKNANPYKPYSDYYLIEY